MLAIAPIRRLAADLLGLLYPSHCAHCGAPVPPGEGPLCVGCALEMLPLLGTAYCSRCGQDAGPFSLRPDEKTGWPWCGHCSARQYRYAALVRVAAYAPPLDRMIKQFKYAGTRGLAGALGAWQADRLEAQPWLSDVEAFVPIPLHWRRRLSRGFNQSELLAEFVAGRLGGPVVRLLGRPVNRPPQAGLPRSQRFENIRGAFAVSRRWRRTIAGSTVCLIDDVCTTGATLSEAARTLRRAGAKTVYAAVVAVAQPPEAYTANTIDV